MPYLVIEKNYEEKNNRIIETDTITYKVYADAIKHVLLQHLKNTGHMKNDDVVDEFYIEVDREFDLMVAVLKKNPLLKKEGMSKKTVI